MTRTPQRSKSKKAVRSLPVFKADLWAAFFISRLFTLVVMVPVITVITSIVVLHETITALAAVGTVLTLAGLFLSESKLFLRKEEKQNGLAK